MSVSVKVRRIKPKNKAEEVIARLTGQPDFSVSDFHFDDGASLTTLRYRCIACFAYVQISGQVIRRGTVRCRHGELSPLHKRKGGSSWRPCV